MVLNMRDRVFMLGSKSGSSFFFFTMSMILDFSTITQPSESHTSIYTNSYLMLKYHSHTGQIKIFDFLIWFLHSIQQLQLQILQELLEQSSQTLELHLSTGV